MMLAVTTDENADLKLKLSSAARGALAASFAIVLAACASGDDAASRGGNPTGAIGARCDPSPAAWGMGSSLFARTTADSRWWPMSAAFPRVCTGSRFT
jgi:hypothetical protein